MLAVVAAGFLVASPSAAAGPPPDEVRGRALFEGDAPLAGRLTGHDSDLPPAASRCSNCHRRDTAPPGAPAPAGDETRSFGPALDAANLAESKPRRGGPPSRYDAASLCRVLRDGIDPAWVMIDRTMPRYQLEDADCEALWRHLIRSGGRP